MDLLRIDMTRMSQEREPIPEADLRFGGRAMTAVILLREVPPTCDPLGPLNKLIFAPGLLSGRGISSASRISIGAKSPLTGGIKESNAGGDAAAILARLSIGALIVQGLPESGRLFTLHIGAEKCTFNPAEKYAGLGTYDLAKALQTDYGLSSPLILLGPAGEMGLLAAGIALTDKDGNPGRLAARGGLGAVMGSKGLKAILLESTRSKPSPPHDPDALKDAIRRYTTSLREDYYTSTVFPEIGTPYMIGPIQKLGALPTRNFRSGTFEELGELEGNQVRETILSRGGSGNTTHACMAGCVVRCSNVVPDSSGEPLVSPIEYESMVLLGPNLGIGSLDAVARFNYRCNDLGLDTVDVGGAIGVLMEAGLHDFGQIQAVDSLLDEVAQGTVLGRVIGNGTATAGRVFGVRRTPVVKGQCVAGYDPRAVKGLGVTYATSPMGADHTAGHTADFPVDHHSPQGKAELSRQAQTTAAAWDSLGLCSFVTGATAPNMGVVVDMLRALDGGSYPDDYVTQLGEEVIRMELTFNRQAGFTSADDRLPEFFTTELLPPFNLVFDVETDDLDDIFGDLT